jgi:hypothetical protein
LFRLVTNLDLVQIPVSERPPGFVWESAGNYLLVNLENRVFHISSPQFNS